MELIGGTDLGRGHGRWMEHDRNGRREYGQGRRGGGQDPFHEQGCAAGVCSAREGRCWCFRTTDE